MENHQAPRKETAVQQQRGSADGVLNLIDPPLWLVTSLDGPRRGGLIASFVVRASIVPDLPRMVLGVAKQHHTWGLIEGSGRFVLHLIDRHRIDLVWRFGLRSGHQIDKFDGIEVDIAPSGVPLIADSPGWLDCRVENRMDSGDRTIYLAAVEAAGHTAGSVPLTVRRLYDEAPLARRRDLEALYSRDGRIDATAIRRWRSNSE